MTELSKKSLGYILKKFTKWHNKLELDSKKNLNPFGFEDLTARDNLDEEDGNEEYFDTLKWVLSEDNKKNIAITGTYGSGKSSILRTFEKLHPEYTYLNISLASFSIERKQNASKLNQLIERSILQQIFYRERPQNIPESRFKRIFSVSRQKVFTYSLLLLIWVFSILLLFQTSIASKIGLLKFFINEKGELFQYSFAISLIFSVGIFWIIYKLFKGLHNFSFSKLNITKGDIELSKEVDGSILNNHLDEILYFFEKKKYDVVVIEDIDRYDDTDIFTKLREINTLLNQSKQVSQRVRFIYAVRDDLFEENERGLNNRTKFFDFIIPVIPVVNPANSGEKLAAKLEPYTGKGKLSREFILDISRYIDDMRMLLNVFNEYILYKKRLNNSSLIQNNLLAMIVFKNIFPKEFSQLQLNRGLIPNIFNEKKKVAISKLNDQKVSHRKKLRDNIAELESMKIDSVEDLNSIYLFEMVVSVSNQNNRAIKTIRVNGNNYSLRQLLKEENFSSLRSEQNIQIGDSRGSYNSGISFKKIEQQVDSKYPYKQRKELIQKKAEREINTLRKELNSVNQEIQSIESYSLAEVFDSFSDEDNLIIESIEEKNDLLVYLLRNGYIDEMYQSYVSYFYEGTLKRKDYDFVLNVKNHKKLSPDYSLKEISQIIKQLFEWEFSQKEILNLDLVTYLLENSSVYKKQLENVFKKLSDSSEESIKFINIFLDNKKDLAGKFISSLSSKWHSIWRYVESESNMEDDYKRKYLALIIKNASLMDIKKINSDSDGLFKEFIENDKIDFIDDEADLKKIKEVAFDLQVKFSNLDYPQSDQEENLFEFINQENLYQLNENMIAKMLKYELDSDDEKFQSLIQAPYTSLMNSSSKNTLQYVESNIQNFVENTLLNKKNFREEEYYFIKLLNKEDLSLDSKKSLILKQLSPISDISKVNEKSLWKAILGESKLIVNWDNALKYYEHYGDDEFLVSYLNNKEDVVSGLEEKTSLDISEEIFKSFLKDLQQLENLRVDCKILFVTTHAKTLTNEEINRFINSLPAPYSRLNKKMNRPKLDKTETNISFVTLLEKRGFVSSISYGKNRITANVKWYLPIN